MHKKINTLITRTFSFTNLSLLILLSVFLLSSNATAATPCTLSVKATSDQTSITSGQTITRTLTIKNIGKTSCRDVSSSVFYSSNEQFVSSSPAPRASDYYWYVGTLNVNKQVTTKITTKHNPLVAGTELSTEACAAATGARDACVASIIPVIATPIVVVPVIPIVSTSTAPTTTPIVITPAPVAGKEKGIWIWSFASQMNTATADSQMNALAANGFNVVYITIDDYIDIASMAEGPAKNSAKAAYFLSLSKFIAKANALGIAVDAEGGWRDWAKPANRWKGYALINAVKEYNALYPSTKLRGFQYDVEPYILPEYETNKAEVLTDFVVFIDQSVQLLAGTDIKFSMAIPHFYDDAQAWTPAITYGGKTMHTFNHLLEILEKKPESDIILMSYRNFFEGTNGTKAISQTEVQEATSGGYSANIIVGQETGNIDPAFTTFYGLSKAELLNNLSQIDGAFSSYAGYGGWAVHYMEPFLVLK